MKTVMYIILLRMQTEFVRVEHYILYHIYSIKHPASTKHPPQSAHSKGPTI